MERVTGNKIHLQTEYHPDCSRRFRSCGGEWIGGEWVFPASAQEAVDNACLEIYGVTGREPTRKARITFLQAESVYCRSILFGGFALCVARGRDSGAKTGRGVILVSGSIGSGGSVKNWTSIIAAGTVFEIEKFPVGVPSTDKISVEYYSGEAVVPGKFAGITDEELTAEFTRRGLALPG